MPYKSLRQERYANANPEKFGGQAVVDEFNQASKGMKLPKRVGKSKLSDLGRKQRKQKVFSDGA